MATIPERIETATAALEAATASFSTGVATVTTKAAEASASATTATEKAAEAGVSAGSAAAALAAAQNVILNQYKGGVAGGAVPNTIAGGGAGDYYDITGGGISQGYTWTTGDKARWNGTSGSWTRIPAGLMDEARALKGDFTRAVRDSFYFDGVTSGQRIWWALGAAGNVQGGPKSLGGFLQFPSSQVNQNRGLWALSDSSVGGGTSGKTLVMHSYGANLYLRFYDGGVGSYKQVRYVNAVALLQGLGVAMALTHDGSAVAPTLYLAGVVFAGTESSTGSPGGWNSVLSTGYLVQGCAMSADITHPSRQSPMWLVNAVLTASEVQDWAQTGRLPAWCELGTGSAIARYASDFSASADSWSPNLVSIAGNIDGIGGRDDNLRATLSGGSSSIHQISRSLVTTLGRAYLYTVDVYIPSTNANPFGVELRANGGGTTLASTTTKDTWVTLSGTFIENSDSQIRLRVSGTVNSDGDIFYTRNAKVYELGLVFRPIVQPIPVVADAGANKIAGVATSGVTLLTERRDWVIQGKTSTNGNQQLLGASVFFDNTKHMLDTVEDNGTGTGTVGVGSASGGAQYVAAAARAAGRNRRTLVTPILASNNIWVSATTTDELTHTIRGHITD